MKRFTASPRSGPPARCSVRCSARRSRTTPRSRARWTHAYHPAFADKQDAGYTPRAGAGPAIKRSALQKYANSLEAIGWLRSVARDASIPLQVYRARSDLASGGTIGPMIASDLAVHSVEVGAPVLAMHSTRETMSCSDAGDLTALMQAALVAPGL